MSNGTFEKTGGGRSGPSAAGPRSGGFGGGGGERSFGGGGGGERGFGGGDEEKRGGRGGGGFGRKKVCRFCADKINQVEFKDQATLKYFVTERGKIIPRRISGNCAKHQRQIAIAIKRARNVALIPYTVMAG